MRAVTTQLSLPVLFAGLLLASPANLFAGQVDTPGRVEFDFSGAPPARVEIDLKNGMLSAITDIVTAAVDGATEGLLEAGEGPAVKESAEHLHAVREILGLTSQVFHEARVRIYEDIEDASAQAAMVEYYRDKLSESNWENVVRVRDDDDSVIVCVKQESSAIRGVFVMVADGNELILTNVVGNLSPERVKQLTSKATKIGLKFGLEDAIEEVMREISRN